MSGVAEFIARGVLIGVGGSALMDVWALVARRAFGIRGLDYGLLGRWIGHFPRGRFVHERIGRPTRFGENGRSAGRRTTRSASPSRSCCWPSGGSAGPDRPRSCRRC